MTKPSFLVRGVWRRPAGIRFSVARHSGWYMAAEMGAKPRERSTGTSRPNTATISACIPRAISIAQAKAAAEGSDPSTPTTNAPDGMRLGVHRH